MSRDGAQAPEPRPAPTACIHVCELDPASGLCRGCHRTAEAICAWPGGSALGGSVFGA
ncbi:MAG TPA: DUF1289 domain-containing protein [Holophagaceae bacterium]|nr:DUF1289 domain-containing protein [Holophagaceae bacterium]